MAEDDYLINFSDDCNAITAKSSCGCWKRIGELIGPIVTRTTLSLRKHGEPRGRSPTAGRVEVYASPPRSDFPGGRR